MIISDTSREVWFYKGGAFTDTLTLAQIESLVPGWTGITIELQGPGGGGSGGATNGGNGGDANCSFANALGGTTTVTAEGGRGGTPSNPVQGGTSFSSLGPSAEITTNVGGPGAAGTVVGTLGAAPFMTGGASFFGGGSVNGNSSSFIGSRGSGGAGGLSSSGSPPTSYIYGGSGSAGGYIKTRFIPRDFIAGSISVDVPTGGTGSAGTGSVNKAGTNGNIGYIIIHIHK